ncbi:MAG TPA: DUF2336 domain-containing protein [Bauldia sp.]|nr:DUF2336 domain-containing protein [Bauldia sp.]
MQQALSTGSFEAAGLYTQEARDATLIRATTELFIQAEENEPEVARRFEDVALHLLPKVPDADRATVAEALADRADAPGMVVRLLARDSIAIAAPLLSRSPVLGSLDLLVVIAATGPEHHRLIAARPLLPPEVIRALRIGGDSRVAAILDRAAPARIAPSEEPAAEETGEATAPAAPEPPWRRSFGAAYGGRSDPWKYLGLDRPARLHIMADLASRPPSRTYAGQTARLDRAFRSILGAAQIVGHARSGEKAELVEAISGGLDLEPAFIYACLDDETGEPLAVLLKALGLDSVQAQQVFLLATAKIGRDANVFFRLCDVFAGMEPSVAETLVAAWRETGRRSAAKHQPLFMAPARPPATPAAPARERALPAIERLTGTGGG